ncbi:hypothetical protein BCR35DRAFT_298408 [Leucosporidium creatinivorum]|uniref:Arrestin-like N-terminal domain-containing protein n=1 Tax=Leucosporidium creatinivorum TaxID=106004 RepID=A0A1Y2G702_9BASI|nr:hypothetical protein BCR35DRAFT_298408 [Leucosporidium creatinivorum]
MSKQRSDSPAGEKVPGFWGRPGSQTRSSSSSRVFSTLGLTSPTLKVDFAEELLYLHPQAEEGRPTHDPSVEGTVTLYLPKARALNHLSIKLTGRTDLGWKTRPYESFVCLEKSIELVAEDKDRMLEKGEHVFAFSMIVPSASAPYERCQYGRVRHFVVAKARGLGNLGGDIHSNEKELFLIVNPGASMSTSAPPPPLHYKMEGLDDALGPWTAALQSQHVMIGGLLLFRINIISVPTDLAIHSIRVKVLQHFTLKSPPGEDPPYIEQPPPDARTVFLLDLQHPPNMGHIMTSTSGTRSGSQTPRSGPLAVLSPGEGYKSHHLVRLLNDNIIRSSTQPGTEASINVRHDIVVEIIYQELQDETESASRSRDRAKGKAKEKERKMFTISKPLDIFSCCCWLDSLTLPPYEEHDPHPIRPEGDVPCMCGFPIAMIVKHHGGTLLQEEGEQGVTYAHFIKDEAEEGARGRPGRPAVQREDTD